MSNIVITNLSKIKDDAKERTYTSDCGDICGIQTNEAPVKYLLKMLTDKEQTVKEIIAVTTKEAEPAFENFENVISAYAEKLGIEKPFIKKVNASDDSFTQTIKDVTRRFATGDSAFIDTTGGFRNSSYILMCVVRILEYSGISLEKAVYSNLEKTCITDITDDYRKYDLINAVDAFTNFGNSRGLAQYFSGIQETAVKEVISAMNDFSDMISLCRTSELSVILERLNKSLLNLESVESKSNDIILFQSLIETIRKKFYMTNDRIEYPDVVKWCLDNRLIQQAVTIYVERMPEYLFEKKIITCSNIDTSRFQNAFDEYYNMLYNGFLKQVTSKTLSPYPFGNFIMRLKRNNPKVFKELCGITSISAFSMEKVLNPDERKGILNLIRIKNCMYANNKRRKQEDVEARKQNTKLQAFKDSDIFNIAATTSEKFVNEILNKSEYLSLLQGQIENQSPKIWNSSDINVIEFIELVLNENNQYKISKFNVEKVKRLLKDLVYIKKYIRNAMNHASDESTISREYDEYYSANGFVVGKEMKIDEIQEFMYNAIENVKSI